MNTQEKAKYYAQFFETAKRVTSDEEFIRLNIAAPQKLHDLIKDIHFDSFDGCLPNDWIYETTLEAFEALENDSLHDIAIEPDIYNTDLAKWLNNPFSEEYCNQAQQDCCLEKAGIYQIIGHGQYLAKERIYHTVNDFIQSEAE